MNKRTAGILVVTLALQGCASGATPGAMVVPLSAERMLVADSPLRKSVTVAAAEGGKETSALWKSNISNSSFSDALKQSLAVHTILADKDGGRFILTAQLVEIKQPFIGFSMTVRSNIKYTLKDAATSQTVFETLVDASYEAKFSDAYLGVERLKLANEGSVRENIRIFVERLIERSASDPAFKIGAEAVAPLLTPTAPNS